MYKPVKTRLGRRLQALFNTLPEGTDILIDLCCDHGALGRAALETERARQVIFNDVHPGIMDKLQTQLDRIGAKGYQLSIEPAQNLTLPEATQGVVILAGVGDEQSIAILMALFSQPQAQQYRFVVSPATKTAFVRHYLRQCSIQLIDDDIVDDAGRCYEIITVTPATESAGSHLSLTGPSWQPDLPVHQRHLNKLLGFYQAQLDRQPSPTLKAICEGYQQILNQNRR